MTRTQPTSLGVPRDLLRDGGDQAAQAMAAITQARLSGGGGLRQQHLATAQRHIAGLDPTRHRALVQHLQGHVLALQGRGGDTAIAHVTPGEFVIPPRLQSLAVMAALGEAAKRAGIDPASLRVGSRKGKTNPRTGHQEFDDDGEVAEDDARASSPDAVDIQPAADDDGIESVTVETQRERSGDPVTLPPEKRMWSIPMPKPEDEYRSPLAPAYLFSCPPRPQTFVDSLARQHQGMWRDALDVAKTWNAIPEGDPKKPDIADVTSRLEAMRQDRAPVLNAARVIAGHCLRRDI